jgi:hypothetical protein
LLLLILRRHATRLLILGVLHLLRLRLLRIHALRLREVLLLLLYANG